MTCHPNKKMLNNGGFVPLVVDLDGTLTPTDTLLESLVQLFKKSPLNLLRFLWWILKGRAVLKEHVAANTSISAELLPYRESLLCYLRQEKKVGRRIVLASAAHSSIVQKVSTYLGLFDEILATEGSHNLKGKAKLDAIYQRLGDEFVYAGDSKADIPIWKAGKAAILVNVSPRVAESIRRFVPIECEFPREKIGISVWLKALRVHQWLKNLLLFVPLLTAFSFLEIRNFATICVAFLAFSFAASSTYIANDLWDLEHDRAHPRKRLRPFARATLPILQGLAAAAVSIILAFILASTVSKGFFLILLSYLALTTLYSLLLKAYVLIDVLTLSLLYTLRIIAGAVAIGINTSSWLLAFSVFMFLSLALVKRCTELISLDQAGKDATRGRDYRVSDLVVLWPLGVGAALSAVVVFGLFISSPETQARYATPHLLWLVSMGLVYWLTRLWIKTSRGEMHDDPVVYAIKDFGSCVTVFGMITTVLVAHFISFQYIYEHFLNCYL